MRLTRLRQLAHDLTTKLRSAAAHLWSGLREATGDAAYESYLRSKSRCHTNDSHAAPPLSARDFYLDSLRRRYSKISRCC